ncbi:MAG: four helix bundle protein [Acidimicrobiia bacterium]
MRNPESLEIWADAMDMAEQVYRATSSFPAAERNGLRSQITRSAVSVPSNIAEGCSRDSKRDFARYLEIAAGSLQELETQALLAVRLRLIQHDDNVLDLIRQTKAKLIKYRRRVASDL